MIIGIAGGTGSGKTTLAKRLSEQFFPNVTLLSHDDYYKARDELSYEERCLINYDEPDAFDNELFAEHISALGRGEAIECPIYDYTEHNRSRESKHIEPARIIIVEGILIFAVPSLVERFDVKIYVDTDDDIRLIRRIERDVKKRGRSLDSVITQYRSTVKPMHDKYVYPSRKAADIIVPEGGKNRVALDMLCSAISRELEK